MGIFHVISRATAAASRYKAAVNHRERRHHRRRSKPTFHFCLIRKSHLCVSCLRQSSVSLHPRGPRPVTQTSGIPCQPAIWGGEKTEKKCCCHLLPEHCGSVWTFRKEDGAAPPPPPPSSTVKTRTWSDMHALRRDTVSLFNSVKHGKESSGNRSDLRWRMRVEGNALCLADTHKHKRRGGEATSVTFHSGGINKSGEKAFYGSQSFAICM